MKYAIVDLLWAKSHGIEILPEMRTSIDQSKVILHEEMLVPFEDESFPRYSFSDPKLANDTELKMSFGNVLKTISHKITGSLAQLP